MDINELKTKDGYVLMRSEVFGFPLLWLKPHVEELTRDEFIHFIADIKLNGLSDALKASLHKRRKEFPNMVPLDFGMLLNTTFDTIISNYYADFKRLGYAHLTHDEVKID
ncbi:MAG: hypothetical protein ACXIT9_08245 [Nitritalea sp.]